MSINSLRNLNFNPQTIPEFTSEGYKLLQGFSIAIPEGTDTLVGRVKEFNKVTNDLAKETAWNKGMPWVVVAVEAALIAATVLGFVFGGPLGVIPLIALFFFNVTPVAGKVSIDDPKCTELPSCCGLLYICYLVRRQSKLESRHQALSQELPGAIRQAADFWQDHGTHLLQKAQDAAKHVSFSPSEPAMNESFKQMEARFEADRQQAQAARNRQAAFEELARQIQIGQQLLAPSAPPLD